MSRAAAALLLGALAVVAGCGGTSPAARGHARPGSSLPTHATATSPRPRRAVARAAGWRLPEPVARETLVALPGGRVLLAGGMLPDETSTADAWWLDLATGRARRAPDLAVPVHDAAAGRYAGRPAVFGGGNTSEQGAVQQLHAGRWRLVDRLPTTRSDLSVAQVGRTTYVLGGYDGVRTPLRALAQGGSGRLRPAGRLKMGVRYAATAVLGGSVYLFGGEVDGRELGVVQRFDARSGRTSVVARLPRPIGHAMAVAVGGRLLLMGGTTGSSVGTRAMWWFDPGTGRFQHAGRLARPLSDAAVALHGRTVYLLGGEDPAVTDRVVRIALS